MPDLSAEYRAAREAVALFDRSALGKVTVTGRDRLAFLQGMLTNDVKGLPPGQGAPAAFLDAHGKVMALLVVYSAAERVLLELPASMTEKTLQTLDRYLISEKADFASADDAFAILSLQGPGARPLLERLAGAPLALPPYAHTEVSVSGVPVRVINRAEGPAPGFHVWAGAEHAETLKSAFASAGAVPAGDETLAVLRVEAGQPWYPQDVDDSVILPETRLDSLVSYTKGCYIGQETVARVKYRGHVNRALSGLVVEGDRVPEAGARVTAQGQEVGRVTSAVRSIALGRPIAMGYVRREHFEPGSAVAVVDGVGEQPARVVALPFVAPVGS
ncbi:MAG TPA: aminomethyltransferase family protein [Candidatus Dormibacteraeota bacterium]|jgi:folate-binding protein YgfZ|nr:aminomethyltransferase family protein [Candidatus Dormibacteraeota bacterium]